MAIDVAGGVIFIFTTSERQQYVQDRNDGSVSLDLAYEMFKVEHPLFVKELFFQLFAMYVNMGGDISFFYSYYDEKFQVLKLSTADGRVIRYF